MGWTVDDLFLVGNGPEQIEIQRTETVNVALAPFEGGLPTGWKPQNGEWGINANGKLTGSAGPDSAAVLWCTDHAEGDHMIEFDGCTVAPAANDLNCFWEGAGKYDEVDDKLFCTIGGLGGWWKGYVGIERSLDNIKRPSGRYVTSCGHLVPGTIFKVAAGRLGDVDFLFVNGVLRMQVNDPKQPRRERSQVAVATWDSQVEISCMRLSRIAAVERARRA